MFIEFREITFQYPGADTHVFKELSCRISGPGFHSLFGPSGVGKTTFVKMIAGKISGFSGEIMAQDKARILYSYNLERLPGWSDVGDHLTEITPASGKSRLRDLTDSFGLEACLESRFAKLSLGQQNRVNLTRYLVQDFDILIMDESLANVDEITREKIILKIKEMFPKKFFLYISHNVAEVSKFCRNILVLRAPHKTPQTMSVSGQNYTEARALEKKALERTMLELVNAS